MWELNWVRRGGGKEWELDDAVALVQYTVTSQAMRNGVRGRGNGKGGRGGGGGERDQSSEEVNKLTGYSVSEKNH